MAASAEIRGQLFDALRSDLIGPGWDDSNDAANRLEQKERDAAANDSLDQTDKRLGTGQPQPPRC